MNLIIAGTKICLYVKDKIIIDGEEIIKKIPLEEYEQIGSRKINSIMYELEKIFDINLKNDLPEIRNKILDGSGLLSRLSKNLIIEIDE